MLKLELVLGFELVLGCVEGWVALSWVAAPLATKESWRWFGVEVLG